MGSRNSVPDTFYFWIIIDQIKPCKERHRKKKKKRINLNLERLTIKDMKQGVMICKIRREDDRRELMQRIHPSKIGLDHRIVIAVLCLSVHSNISLFVKCKN